MRYYLWMRIILLLIIAITSIYSTALARPMITDLSERKIDIDAKFVGKELLLYGARVEAGDIVVVIRGPKGNYVVRKKEDIGGIWVNTAAVEFEDVPQFFLMAASDNIENIDAEILKEKLGVGFETLQFDAKTNSAKADINEFQLALSDKMELENLYTKEALKLPLLEGTLFRIRINFPEKIVSGIYTAEIYSFDDGELRGIQSIPIKVEKVGLEAWIYDIAHNNPALYGLLAIFMAASMGWIAGNLFKKV